MDPVLPEHSSHEPKKSGPIESTLIDLSDHVLEPNHNHVLEPNHDADTSCSSSTTSDTSDGDDFFQLDPIALNHLIPSNPIDPLQPSQLLVQSSSSSSFNAFEDEEISLSDRHKSRNNGHEDPNQAQPGTPPLPPINRNDVPDPNRIPLSVFARTKSTTPMEWSVASNESLFSIHMGNSSFSRDHVLMMGKSGELTNFNFSSTQLDNYPMPPLSPVSPVPPPFSPPIPSVLSSPTELDDVGLENVHKLENVQGYETVQGLGQPCVAAAANAEAVKDVLRATAEEHETDMEKRGPDMMNKSVSRQSDGSATSFRSFAFPILGDGRSGSIKVEPEHQRMHSQQEHQTPKVSEKTNTNTSTNTAAPTAATEEKGWFSCFTSCFPSCR